jgi:hypothetical protein
MKEHTMLRRVWVAVAVLGLAAGVSAQEPGQQGGGPGAFAGMQRAGGEVTAVNGANLTIKTEDGSSMQIVTTTNTRVMKGRGVTVAVADLKVGDGVMAMGNLDAPNKTLHAAMVMATDAAQLKALRENLGKTYIAGKVTAIDLDNAKMTVERADKVSQTILFDDSTSFKRGGRGMGRMEFGGMGAGAGAGAPSAGATGGESITLADIKVGDNVAGQGSIKGGTFVPTQLYVTTPGQRRRPPAADATTPAPK